MAKYRSTVSTRTSEAIRQRTRRSTQPKSEKTLSGTNFGLIHFLTIFFLCQDGSGSDSESSPEPEQLPKSRFDVSLDAFKKLLQQEEEESIEEEEDEEAGELPPDVLELSIEV